LKLLWHSCAPWLGTGYATQTAAWTRYLKTQGYDVAISSYYSGEGDDHPGEWEGFRIFNPPATGYSSANVAAYAREHRADVIIVLADVWLMPPDLFAGFRTLCWTPVDAEPLSLGDSQFFRQAPATVTPVAMSAFGQQVMAAAGVHAPLIPHAVDTSVFHPDPQREALRAAYGIAVDEFAIGMNSNNIDPIRKGIPEQMHAFASLARDRKATLFVHSRALMKGSCNLPVLAITLGVRDRVRFSDQERMVTGDFTDGEMARWYAAMDVLTNASYGEGFGLTPVEAQLCGTPAVVSDGSTGREVCSPAGWFAKTEPFWNPVHNAWWHRPSVKDILRCYRQAAAGPAPFKRDAVRAWAMRYDIETVGPRWLELLEGL
jgi:glycosyltransferase involved in cell wall biosynthesis